MIQPPVSTLPACLATLIKSNELSQKQHLLDVQSLYISASHQHVLSTDLEAQLKTFIQWSLQQSYFKHYSQDIRLQILNCAWEAQKLLWSIR